MNLFDSVRYFFTTRLSRSTFRFHRFVLERTGGKLLPTSGRMPVFLLTTTGRNSGQPRTQPLSYLRDGDCYVVVASNAGQPHDPAWHLNLTANPEATIRIGGRSICVHAETAGPADQARPWPDRTPNRLAFLSTTAPGCARAIATFPRLLHKLSPACCLSAPARLDARQKRRQNRLRTPISGVRTAATSPGWRT